MWASKIGMLTSIQLPTSKLQTPNAKLPKRSEHLAPSNQAPWKLGVGGWELRPSLIEIHPDRFDLRVVLERVGAHFSAEAALLVAAERGRRIVDVVSVDPDGSRLELPRHVVCFLDVAGPDAGGQPVGRIVGHGD